MRADENEKSFGPRPILTWDFNGWRYPAQWEEDRDGNAEYYRDTSVGRRIVARPPELLLNPAFGERDEHDRSHIARALIRSTIFMLALAHGGRGITR